VVTKLQNDNLKSSQKINDKAGINLSNVVRGLFFGCHDTQHNSTQSNDSWDNNIMPKTLTIITFSLMAVAIMTSSLRT
jgi:hypothetical protein